MPYQSPLHIAFYFYPDTPYDQVDLKRVQKQFFAEFNLNGNSPIVVNKKEYSKDSILKALEQLQKNENIEIHLAIFENKDVLSFFENFKSYFSLTVINEFCETLKDHKQNEYFRDILTESLCSRIKHLLNKREYSYYKEVFWLGRHLSEINVIKIDDVISNHLLTLKEFTIAYPHSVKEFHISEQFSYDFGFVSSENFASFLNSLPDEFINLKSDIIEAFIELIRFCSKEVYVLPSILLQLINELLLTKGVDEWWINNLLHYKRKIEDEIRLTASPPIRGNVLELETYNDPQLPEIDPIETTRIAEGEGQQENITILGRIRKILNNKKTDKVLGVLVVVVGTLSYVLWNTHELVPITAGFILSLIASAVILNWGKHSN